MGRRRPRTEDRGWLEALRARVEAIEPETASLARRAAAYVVVAVVVVAGIGFGLRTLERQVDAMPRYDAPLRVEWVGVPTWVQNDANRHVLDELTAACGVEPGDRMLDPQLARRIGERLRDSGLAWISQVQRVAVRPDGVVAISCEFRRPMAWVRQGGYAFLIGDDGVRLPGRYHADAIADSPLVVIDGVTSEAPAVGAAWEAADVDAGMRVVLACAPRRFNSQIRRVRVDNHLGRVNPLRPQIELMTDRPGSRIWWGRAPGEEHGCEISSDQKIALLESLYRQSGRIDMNRSYVNVTTWPDRVTAPTPGEAVASNTTHS